MNDRKYLTRKEAAAYIARTWFTISAASLARYASEGKGPPYRQIDGGDGAALYLREDIDRWAEGFPVKVC